MSKPDKATPQEQAKLDEFRRDVPPDIEETEAAARSLQSAILALQAEMPTVKKDGTNPHFRSRYATLGGIWADIRPLLTKHGIAVTNRIKEGNVVTTATLVSSGESVTSEFPFNAAQPPQAIGSAITYARRYNLCAIFQIITDEDDDGDAATPDPSF